MLCRLSHHHRTTSRAPASSSAAAGPCVPSICWSLSARLPRRRMNPTSCRRGRESFDRCARSSKSQARPLQSPAAQTARLPATRTLCQLPSAPAAGWGCGCRALAKCAFPSPAQRAADRGRHSRVAHVSVRDGACAHRLRVCEPPAQTLHCQHHTHTGSRDGIPRGVAYGEALARPDSAGSRGVPSVVVGERAPGPVPCADMIWSLPGTAEASRDSPQESMGTADTEKVRVPHCARQLRRRSNTGRRAPRAWVQGSTRQAEAGGRPVRARR